MASVGPRTSQVKNIEAIDDLDTMYKTMEALGLPTREHKSIESMKSSVKKLLEVSVMKSSVKAGKLFEAISDANAEDARRCREMTNLYTETEVYLDMLDYTISELIHRNFGDVRAMISSQKKRLKRDKCYILVAGETGAGKSSLMNLILGEELLPSAVLSTTSTICELKYDEKRSVTVHFKDKDPVTGHTTKSFLLKDEKGEKPYLDPISEYVHMKTDREKETPYKKVELFWPHPLLKDGVVIVDSPGIGESDIMDNQVMQYLPEATAFIYVINSSNAGGVQKDRIVKLLDCVREMSAEEQAGYSPGNALFVCNKCDTIPQKEAKDVKTHITEKLKKSWPDIDTDTQIVYLSTAKAIHAQTLGVVNEALDNLLTNIKRLVLNSMQARLEVSWRWLDLLLSRIVYYTKALLQKSTTNRLETKSRIAAINSSLLLFEEKQSVVEDLHEHMVNNVSEAVTQLKNYLNSDSVKTEFCRWTLKEVPPADSSLEETMVNVRMSIERRFQNTVNFWEEKNGMFAKCRESLMHYFLRKYAIFEEQLQNLESEVIEPGSGYEDQLDTAHLNAEDLPVKAKVMIGVTSPIWIPLGLAALVVGAPVMGVKAIKDKMEQKKMIKMYKSDPCSVMEKESRLFLKGVSNDEELTKFVEAQMVDADICLKQIKARIPELIAANNKLCQNLQDEARSQDKIVDLYDPMLKRGKELQGDLGMLAVREIRPLELNTENVEWKKESGYLVGQGAFAYVYRGKLHQQKEPKVIDIAVKDYKEVLTKHNVVQFLAEEDNLRKLQHQNIVRFYGSVFRTNSDKQVHACIVLELCKTSLRSHIFDNPQENVPSRSVLAREQTFRWLKGIVLAVIHMHRKGDVHRDLKLDNILVSTKGQIKVSDVGFTKKEQDITGTVCGTPVYMAPEVYDEKKYSSKADIYSLGIIMWEMWYGRQAFQEKLGCIIQFFKCVKEGYRPSVVVKGQTPPPTFWQFLMQSCWQMDPGKRPTAEECYGVIKSRTNC